MTLLYWLCCLGSDKQFQSIQEDLKLLSNIENVANKISYSHEVFTVEIVLFQKMRNIVGILLDRIFFLFPLL